MGNRYARTAVIAAAAALIAALAFTPGGWDAFRYRTGGYDIEGETKAVKESIRLFSATYAGFYASAGGLEGLNVIPAAQMVKRRIFQDILAVLDTGRVLVLDRDRSDVRRVQFTDLTHAVAVVDEAWFMAYQDYFTRRPLPDKKANYVTVRYFLKKQWGRWIVFEYDVFGQEDQLPPLRPEVVNTW